MNQEQSIAMKSELVKTMNSIGWRVVMELAEQAVREAEEEVWACQDRDKRDDLVLKGQAARDFLLRFKQMLGTTTNVQPIYKAEDFAMVSVD